jgi:hypothetical protein
MAKGNGDFLDSTEDGMRAVIENVFARTVA